jgi:hypothetical protein
MLIIKRLTVLIALICAAAAHHTGKARADEGETPTPPAKTVELKQNSPNPFNPHTVITYYLPDPGRVRLEVFDARGRSVKVLVDKAQPAGDHSVNWDGRDSRGSMSPSGVYFYRLTAGRTALTRKMILLR